MAGSLAPSRHPPAAAVGLLDLALSRPSRPLRLEPGWTEVPLSVTAYADGPGHSGGSCLNPRCYPRRGRKGGGGGGGGGCTLCALGALVEGWSSYQPIEMGNYNYNYSYYYNY